MDKTSIAKAYVDLVKAGRRDIESVPEQIKTEFNQLWEADQGSD